MAGQHPEEQVPVPVVRQGWRDVTFLHWAYDPDVVARLLPALTLEAGSLATTIAARAGFGVPYRWAWMEVRSDGGTVEYLSTRRSSPAVGHRIVVRPRPPGDWRPGAHEHWLTGRWRAWARLAGRLATVPVHHAPWPLRPADLVELEEGLVAAAGLPPPGAPPLVHFSPGVGDVRLGPPCLLRRARAEPGGTA